METVAPAYEVTGTQGAERVSNCRAVLVRDCDDQGLGLSACVAEGDCHGVVVLGGAGVSHTDRYMLINSVGGPARASEKRWTRQNA